ncbi:MAG: tetraacyldisaccharide 4'-kinase [Elusimicrobia bacterium]|nr:tetraacyldisaccharide 4'-kinase [Elusimicrobiota bacterium]
MVNKKKWSLQEFRNGIREHAAGRLFLGLLAVFYLAAIKIRAALYSAGLLKTATLIARIVCFGNLSAGGTGKTSMVAAAARALKQQGRNPAVLIRGYKRRAPKNKVTVLHSGGIFSSGEAGDEALMLYNMLKDTGVPVLVCADRRRAGLTAIEKFRSDILLLDDGYQFFKLRRDADIVLINAAAPFYADSLLPLGNLRESPSGLKRAGAIIISHCEHATQKNLEILRAEIKKINPGAPVIESMHSPDTFIDALTHERVPLSKFRDRSVAALSGIGDPKSFEATLASLKAELVYIWRYPDHHQFTYEELAALEAARGDLPVITTYKDFARFPGDWAQTLKGGVFILSVKIVFLCDGYKVLMDVIAPERSVKSKEL